MPSFTYLARDQKGAVQTGQLDALSEDEVVAMLQHRGLLVTSISRKDLTQTPRLDIRQRRRLHGRVTMQDQVLLCQQLAVLVEAGVPLLKSLKVVSAQVESRSLLVALEEIRRDVEAGRTFRDALARHPRVFSTLWLNLVETGEASGHLGQSLQQLARHFEASQHLQNEVKTALTYPAFLIGAAILVLAVFMYWIIPKFSLMFQSMDMELPLITRLVLGVSQAAQRYWVGILLAAVGSGWLLLRYLRTEAGQWMRDRLVLRLPLFGLLMTYAQLAEFAQGLSTLLQSGVPLLSDLEILSKTATNKLYGRAIGEVRDAVKEGKPMAEPMAQIELFPPMTVQMILVGEEVGELGRMASLIATYYKECTETFIARMTRLFEPIAIVFMGGVVLVIVLSIFMPIFKMASGANIH